MDLFYKEYGEGEPLLILHGLLGASGNWHSLSRNVFARYFQVYALDLRNHGRSPHETSFDYPSMVQDVKGMLDKAGIARANILGHSMGGKVAMWLALQHADRVNRLIVVDMATRAYPPHHQHIFEGLRSLDLTQYSSRTEVDRALASYVEQVPVRQFLLKNLASNGSGSFSWKMNLESIYENYPKINEAVISDNAFQNPSMFVKGGASSYIREEDQPGILKLFPQTQFVTIPNAGHWVHAEAPKPFSESVLNFLGT